MQKSTHPTSHRLPVLLVYIPQHLEMASGRNSSYEPYRQVGRDGDDSDALLRPGPEEKPLHTARQANPSRLPRAPPTSGIRTTLRAFGLAIAVSVLGIQVYTIYVWLDTRHDTYHNTTTGLRTRSWPPVDSWPAYLMLSVGAFGTVVELLALTSLCSCVSFTSVIELLEETS